MRLMKSNKGSMNTGTIEKFIVVIILIVIVVAMAAVLVPLLQTEGNKLNASGVPLGSLFASDSVVPLAVMAGIVIAVIISALAIAKFRK